MTSAEAALARFHPSTAWRPFFPNGSNIWDEEKVAHLFRRATGGVSWPQLQAGLTKTPAELVHSLVAGPGRAAEAQFERDMAVLSARFEKIEDLQAYWLYRLLHSPHPLKERLTLFWHDHFATSHAKVKSIPLMHRQNETLRRHALGHFDALLAELTFDPAMILWLDGQTNQSGKPNENYAREVMELFSLGVGNYTEQDIREAARALTGWTVENGEAVFDPERHDSGAKTLLGQTGNWTAGDVVRICLAQPACARFLVRKLFRFLISETVQPSDGLLQQLVDGFRARNYDIAWLTRQMLGSWVFFSPAAIGQIVKSPFDYITSIIRAMDGRPNLIELAQLCDQLGQNLFHPPSVEGWDGGPAWLNSTALLRRHNAAYEATLGNHPRYRTDPVRFAVQHGLSSDESLVTFFLRLFYQKADPATVQSLVTELALERGPRSPSDPDEFARTARAAAHLAAMLPEFQVA